MDCTDFVAGKDETLMCEKNNSDKQRVINNTCVQELGRRTRRNRRQEGGGYRGTGTRSERETGT